MEPELEKEVRTIIKETVKVEHSIWITLAEKIVIPIILGISTLTLGYISFSVSKSQMSQQSKKQEQEYINSLRIQERDSINSRRNFQLNLLELYLKTTEKDDLQAQENGKNLLFLMDSSIATKLTGLPLVSNINSKGEPEFSQESLKKISIQRDVLLKYSNVKVYYEADVSQKANSIDSILKLNGAKSVFNIFPRDYPRPKNNQIVYYSISQLNYCQAVQDLLRKNNFGEFIIRPSSDTSYSQGHFKIYVVRI